MQNLKTEKLKLKTMISPNWKKKKNQTHMQTLESDETKIRLRITESPIREKQRNPHAKLANREIKAQTMINPRIET